MGQQRGTGHYLLLTLAILVAGGLAACREEDQGRHLTLEKGSYQGPADQPLAQEQLDQLGERARYQNY